MTGPIDIHAHFVPPELIRALEREGARLGVRIEEDAQGAKRARFAGDFQTYYTFFEGLTNPPRQSSSTPIASPRPIDSPDTSRSTPSATLSRRPSPRLNASREKLQHALSCHSERSEESLGPQHEILRFAQNEPSSSAATPPGCWGSRPEWSMLVAADAGATFCCHQVGLGSPRTQRCRRPRCEGMTMAIQVQVTAREMGRALAEAVRDEPAVKRLWASANRDRIELSILTDPTDADTERRLYAAGLILHDRFPDAYFLIDVINPIYFISLDLQMLIPNGAQEIPVRPE